MRFRRRLILLYVLFCCLMGVVWLRATQLQWLDGDVWAEAARKQRQRTEPLDALRGPILSSDGIELAVDRPGFQLAVVAWDWQRRARARCTGCGAIYHQRGWRTKDGVRKPIFPRRCACVRYAAGERASGAYPRSAPAGEQASRLEELPPADLRPLEEALGLEPGELDTRAEVRVKHVETLIAEMRARMEREGDDSAFREKRLEMRAEDLLRRPFVWVRRVPPDAARLVLTDEYGTYEGFEVQTALARYYPLGDFAAQLLGFTSQLDPDEYKPLKAEHGERVTFSTRVGRRGLERAYNWQLHGDPGHRVLELDDDGQWGELVEDRPPRPGKPLLLSLHAGVSRDAERLLFADPSRGPAGYVPRGQPSGAFVALDAYTGEILVWAEAPRFDLNEDLGILYDRSLVEAEPDEELGVWVPKHPLEKRMTLEEWRERIVQPAPVGMSRVAQVAVEPGSTFKPLIALGLLHSGRPLPFASYSCDSSSLRSPGCHGSHRVDLVGAIELSCNRYFAYTVRDSKHWPHYRRFLGGFVESLGIGSRPSLEVREWSAGQWLWPYVDFTPAQLLAETSAWLEAAMGEQAPRVHLQLSPGAPASMGGDPKRFGRRLGQVARWLAKRTGADSLHVGLERQSVVDRDMVLKVAVRAAGRHGWHHLPGTVPSDLPAFLTAMGPGRAGISGHLERGGSVWFTVTVPRRVGRTSDEEAKVIRPDDGRNVGIGQGPVLVTPLQMARAMAVLANGGILVTPHVVNVVGGTPTQAKSQRLPLDPHALDEVREGMWRVANADGTARRAQWHRVPATVYGKTGTAQVGKEWRPFGETEDGGPWHHWFVGFAEAPGCRTIAFACLLHSRAEGGAGGTAAHATVDILERWFATPAARTRR